MEKLNSAQELQKVERSAMEKNLAALNARGFLSDDEATLRDPLVKRLAAGVSEAAFEKAFKGAKLNLHSL